jgi:hypothetical protein
MFNKHCLLLNENHASSSDMSCRTTCKRNNLYTPREMYKTLRFFSTGINVFTVKLSGKL